MDKSRLIEDLNDLLTRNYDAEKGFETAKDNVKDVALKAFFMQKAAQRYQFGHEIKDLIRSLGGKIYKGTSMTGDLHRGWINIKGILSMNTAEAILEEVERGEETCLEDYDNFLNNHPEQGGIKGIIRQQRNYIARSLNRVEELEEVYES